MDIERIHEIHNKLQDESTNDEEREALEKELESYIQSEPSTIEATDDTDDKK